MRKICFLLFFIAFAHTLSFATTLAAPIILTLPEQVIAEAAAALLPYHIDARAKALEGDVTIKEIRDLKFTDDLLSCRLQLAGKNLAFLTEIAGHGIRLKVGELEVAFHTEAAIRFDEQKQTLYIKPVIRDLDAKGSGANDEIGKALVAILNGREFPISLNEIEPLVADTGSKQVTIAGRIIDIKARSGFMELRLAPVISAKK